MATFGIDNQVLGRRVLTELKLNSGYHKNMKASNIKQIFRQLDVNNSGYLDHSMFEQALTKIGFFPKKTDMQILLKYLDKDGNQQISIDELLGLIETPMNPRRQQLIEKVFQQYQDCEKGMSVAMLGEQLDFSWHPSYMSRSKTNQQLLDQYLANFHIEDGVLTKKNMMDYFDEQSLAVPNDQEFSQMVTRVWRVSEHQQSEQDKQIIRKVLSQIRLKILTKTQGSTTENTLRKIFKKYDSNNNGIIGINELQAILIDLDLQIDMNYMTGLLNQIDKNQDKVIQFEEFIHFMLQNPYT